MILKHMSLSHLLVSCVALALSWSGVTGCSSEEGPGSSNSPVGPRPEGNGGSPTTNPSGSAGPGVGPANPNDGPVIVGDDDDGGEQLRAGIRRGDKVDLLFVVDNSTSMGDKQAIFRAAIPDLIDMLVNPPCITDDTEVVVNRDAEGNCPPDSTKAFDPVTDIHIGVISSSLGDHGLGPDQAVSNPVCPDQIEQNDKAYLIGLRRDTALYDQSYAQFGFLVWDGGDTPTHNPPGDSNQADLVQKFQAQVDAVGERGCGFEAPLEAAYRFLIEPEPYQTLERVPCNSSDTNNSCVEPTGIDQDLLTQRSLFLRPDSALVVFYLTDENDCSVRDSGQGYYTLRLNRASDNASTPLAKGTSACSVDPNDRCCQSCSAQTRDGCPSAPDNGCDSAVGLTEQYEAGGLAESFNIRCHDQKRRFGIDFLYSPERYIAGFTRDRVEDRSGSDEGTPNPLFSQERGKERVFVVGIVGTPWQDLAIDVADPNGDVNRAADIPWARFLRDPADPGAFDPFNAESIAPRTGANPVVPSEMLGGPGTMNAINGHEREIVSGDGLVDDLQYACIFPLEPPRDCAAETEATACDCTRLPSPIDPSTIDDYATDNPLCRNPDDGTYGTMQYFAKAYPSPRVMQVVRGMGDQGVLGSICPKNTTDPSLPDFGYRPPLRALLLGLAGDRVR